MTTEELKDFEVKLRISAACEADARELLEDYTGQETDIRIDDIEEVVI
jgi:hypothetical protein